MSNIIVKFGEYRNQPVVDQAFEMVKGYQVGKKGCYVTVKNNGFTPMAIDQIKIKVRSVDDIEVIDGDLIDNITATKTVIPETDEEVMTRISSRFSILDEMAAACIRGDIRSLIVSGPPGIGKSFGVETQLEKAQLFTDLAGAAPRHTVIKGSMTALGLYVQLYKFSDKKNTLVFDDCDVVFGCELMLNIMKAALDSGKRRKICWNSDSRLLREENIPNSFDFHGSAIFITNLQFSNIRSKKLQDHLAALESRCHFVDLTINSERDKMLRIKQVARDANGGLFAAYNFKCNENIEVLEYMEANQTRLRELSIRTALKIADLVKISPSNWKSLAENTIAKR